MKSIVAIVAVAVLGVLVWTYMGQADEAPLAGLEPTRVEEARTPHVPANLERPIDEVVAAPQESLEPDSVDEQDTAPAPAREVVPGSEYFEVRGDVHHEHTNAPVPEFSVTLERDGEIVDAMQSDDQGAFEFTFRDFAPERFQLRVDPPLGWVVKEPLQSIESHHVDAGTRFAFAAKQWPPPIAGDISGWLRAEKGSFSQGTIPRTNHLVLDLVSTEHPPIKRRGNIERTEDARGTVLFVFRFEDVPEGEYNLTLSSLGNYRWEPTSVLVSPPASSIEFLRYDLDQALPVVFRVFDAKSREPIEDFDARHIKQTNSEEHGVFLHTGPLESEQFPLDMPFDWSVEADGYATAYGDESAFTIEDGSRVADVYLARGWSTRFLVMGGMPHTRPLSGADIVLDGEVVGRTGPDGGLNVSREEAPGSVEVRYFGWTLAKPISIVEGVNSRSRSRVTPVLLKEPE